MKKLLYAFFLCICLGLVADCHGQATAGKVPSKASNVTAGSDGQALTSTTSTLSLSIGANALGIGGTSQGTPATEIVTGLSLTPHVTLLQVDLEAPGADLQYYGGGLKIPLPYSFLSQTSLAKLRPYMDATVGADRIVPTTGNSASHLAFEVGGGLGWQATTSVAVSLVQVNLGHFPGAAWGNNSLEVSGGLLILLSKH